MRDIAADIAILEFRKDALLTEWAAELAWWRAVQGIALGAEGVAVVGHFDGSLGAPSLVWVGALAAIALAFGSLQLARYRKRFRTELNELLGQLARLKGTEVE